MVLITIVNGVYKPTNITGGGTTLYLYLSVYLSNNDCLLLGHAPDHWKISKAIMIYKDNHECSRTCQLDLQNLCLYDPATPLTLLTNISIHTNMVFARIDFSPLLYFSSVISPNFFERHSTSLYILFLDWSQAFDSIGHPHLAAALRRYGAPRAHWPEL